MRGTSSSRMQRYAFSVLLCAVLTLGPVMSVHASPAEEIRATRAKAQEAQKRLDGLAADLEERSEEYLAAREALAETRSRIRVTAAELEAAENDVALAQEQLNGRADSIYRGGGIGIVSVVLGATDFRDLVTRLDLMQAVGRSDAALVSRVERARMKVARAKRSLENRRAEQVVLVQRTSEQRASVKDALAAQKDYLDKIDRDLKTLIAKERARQERIARERAEAKAREAAKAAAAKRASGGSGGSGNPNLPAATGSVVAIARSFVGKVPYVWGGVTPSGFDCSGFTMYCYRQVGVNLPRTSRQQFNVGQRIPSDRTDLLSPGDLVFFGTDGDASRIHHVGIYSGAGTYIHAPQTGEMVSESSLLARIETRGDYVGAVRP